MRYSIVGTIITIIHYKTDVESMMLVVRKTLFRQTCESSEVQILLHNNIMKQNKFV